MIVFKKVLNKPGKMEDDVMQDIVNALFMDGPSILVMGDATPDDFILMKKAGYLHVDSRILKKELKSAKRQVKHERVQA